MKSLILIVLIIMSGFLLAIVSFDQRQAAVVTNHFTHKQYALLLPGVHLAYPVIDKVDYVYMQQQYSTFTGVITFSDGVSAKIGVTVFWQVINPLIYDNIMHTDANQLQRQLAHEVTTVLKDRVQSTNLSTLNQLDGLLDNKITLNGDGVVIDNIAINRLQLLPLNKPTQLPPTTAAHNQNNQSH